MVNVVLGFLSVFHNLERSTTVKNQRLALKYQWLLQRYTCKYKEPISTAKQCQGALIRNFDCSVIHHIG